jgi:hypothetical protein
MSNLNIPETQISFSFLILQILNLYEIHVSEAGSENAVMFSHPQSVFTASRPSSFIHRSIDIRRTWATHLPRGGEADSVLSSSGSSPFPTTLSPPQRDFTEGSPDRGSRLRRTLPRRTAGDPVPLLAYSLTSTARDVPGIRDADLLDPAELRVEESTSDRERCGSSGAGSGAVGGGTTRGS